MKNKTEIKELKKIYKDVHTCKECEKVYGSDEGTKEKSPNICPLCEKK